ncbi:MAG: hypothetical protein K8S24_01475, partial [Candidatus Aegiribacteria sp.]|nr:hypothetical protein [Candidatus Aegiribacteria sp.]
MIRTRSIGSMAVSVFFAATVTLVFVSSCIDDPPTHPEFNDYQSYIDLVWGLYDQQYVSFDVKNIDWDAVHDEYIQLAEDVDSFDQLQYLIIEMVGKLEDKNAWLYLPTIPRDTIPTYIHDIEMNYDIRVMIALLIPWHFEWDPGFSSTWGHCVIDTIP